MKTHTATPRDVAITLAFDAFMAIIATVIWLKSL
jgi:hypothetical protein